MTADHSQFILLSSYNEWMNVRLYEAASKLSAEELMRERKAFFGSIHGTLNHLVVADTIWLQRFATQPAAHRLLDPIRTLPAPSSLDQIQFGDLAALSEHRQWLDRIITKWITELDDEDLHQVLRYANSKGVVADRRLSHLLLHFFNHQTHHRGQVTTLLSQAGVDVGVTDLLMLIPNEIENERAP